MQSLKGKRVLFIAPVFYEYHREIIAEMQGLGAVVDFFPERSYSITFSVINTISKEWLRRHQEKHYESILKHSAAREYDVLFVIRGWGMPAEFVRRFRNTNPSAWAVMYQWDGLQNHDYRYLIDEFNTVSSFDRADCSMDVRLRYQPLFFTKSYGVQGKVAGVIEDIDLVFIGGLHGDRYDVLSRIIEKARSSALTSFIHLYSPLRSQFKARLLGMRDRHGIVRSRQITPSLVAQYMQRARCVLDIESPSQSGLTIRTFEVLALGKKLITTNGMVVNEPCYDANYVSVIDRSECLIDCNFVRGSLEKKPDMTEYSLKNWLQRILAV